MLETTRLEDLQEQFKDALIQANSTLLTNKHSDSYDWTELYVISSVRICRLQ
jgi:hypothetical protein